MSGVLRNRRAVIGGAVVATIVGVGVGAGVALLGGGGNEKSSAATRASSTSSSTSTTVASRPGGVIAPLTGLRDLTSGAANRPALTIKVENTPAARPQIGLDQADVVYEEVVESNITRLLAIFQSHVPAVVGPVRSVRRTDQGVVTRIGGIFAYSGGAQYAIASIRTAPVTLVDETRAGDAMFRDHSREKPHNLFARPAALFAFGGTPVPPPPIFAYRGTHARVPGASVTHVDVGFGNGYAVSYEWNRKHKSWDRSIFGHTDLVASGVQESPRNVVALFVNYSGGAGVIGAEAELVGEGDAVVFTGGHRIDARWVRPDRSQPIRLRDAAGAVVRLTPGQTWVELAPIGTPSRRRMVAPHWSLDFRARLSPWTGARTRPQKRGRSAAGSMGCSWSRAVVKSRMWC